MTIEVNRVAVEVERVAFDTKRLTDDSKRLASESLSVNSHLLNLGWQMPEFLCQVSSLFQDAKLSSARFYILGEMGSYPVKSYSELQDEDLSALVRGTRTKALVTCPRAATA